MFVSSCLWLQGRDREQQESSFGLLPLKKYPMSNHVKNQEMELLCHEKISKFIQFKLRIKKQNNDATKQFQNSWAPKLSWQNCV